MFCPNCGASLPPGARYCPSCGEPVLQPEPEPLRQMKERPRFDVFFLTLLGSLALTFILVFVFHLPIFIFGAFLPFFWRRSRRES